MIKILFTSAVISMLAMSSEPKVYICDSENAVAYHFKKDCRGIKQCKKEILEVTKEKVVKKGLKRCAIAEATALRVVVGRIENKNIHEHQVN